MYTSVSKARQSEAMKKFALNSNKSPNNFQPLVANSKIRDMANEMKIPSQINKRNLNKSKFTVLSTSKLPKQTTANASLSGKGNAITKREPLKPDPVRKSNIPITSAGKVMPVNKVVLTESSSFKKRIGKRKAKPQSNEKMKSDSNINVRESCEMSVQTNEAEILNHLLIVGDFKIITPSKPITDEIDKLQKQKEKEKMLMSRRKFEEHSQKDEQHLDDLKEYLDKNFITRKIPKLRDNIDDDRRLIESMDELLQREKPKTESITDIRSRIKQKEKELLSLFDHFQKKNGILAK